MAKRIQDQFTRTWIIQNSIEITRKYEAGVLTLRGLHYQLVARGMTNTLQHYKRVVTAMIKARWDGTIRFEAFSDHERAMIGQTDYSETDPNSAADNSEYYIKYYLNNYYKNRWENQEYYVEVFIEKKALQGAFDKVCSRNKVALGACKGYPSLTFLNDTAKRFIEAEELDKKPVILYFGDYDPSGEDIPRSIKQNLFDLGVEVEVDRIALLHDQVIEWGLPAAPTKLGDSRSANWDGIGQVELDAVDYEKLYSMAQDSIDKYFDYDKHARLLEQEAEEKKVYIERLKEYVKTL